MSGKRKRSISFDVMVKFFIKHYGIPTKKDIDKLNLRLDRLEQLIKKTAKSEINQKSKKKMQVENGEITASDRVFDIIKNAKDGIRFSEILEKTEFEEKKLRNIVFQLKKTGRIRYKHRGTYIVED